MSSSESSSKKTGGFDSFGLSKPLIKVLNEVGYETPSPIQQECIPHILNGDDIIGQAQTGTGKTAAFALPLLDLINLKDNYPQVLVLAPTRELAIQVAEAIQSYARYMKGFHVLPIYGGQAYNLQLRPLKRGVHIVVGTPGRVMDHIKKGTLKLDRLKALVLDEADEMLRMGFIDDVKWVMEKLPEKRQIALFSATMPDIIRRVAERFLNKPKVIKIKSKTTTATTIRQRYWQVSGTNKLDALTRILEVEPFDALIIFVRTKNATTELEEKLLARGFAATAINGDIAQKNRERTIGLLKQGKIDILIATDVAARGLDVERISHVINYDIPYDPESYVHRIGRTGRAGRTGDAILFVAPREKRMLKSIERVTRQPIEPMRLPSAKLINEQRISSFKQKITDTLSNRNLDAFQKIIEEYTEETGTDPVLIASALALMAQGKESLLVSEAKPHKAHTRDKNRTQDSNRSYERERTPRFEKERRPHKDSRNKPLDTRPRALKEFPDIKMLRYKVEIGEVDDVKPGNLVGAIANEGEIESCYIGSIEIYDTFSTVDLPDGMPKETFIALNKAWVCGKPLKLSEMKKEPRAPTKKTAYSKDKASSFKRVKKHHKSKPRSKKRISRTKTKKNTQG